MDAFVWGGALGDRCNDAPFRTGRVEGLGNGVGRQNDPRLHGDAASSGLQRR